MAEKVVTYWHSWAGTNVLGAGQTQSWLLFQFTPIKRFLIWSFCGSVIYRPTAAGANAFYPFEITISTATAPLYVSGLPGQITTVTGQFVGSFQSFVMDASTGRLSFERPLSFNPNLTIQIGIKIAGQFVVGDNADFELYTEFSA